jgi:hypothetical protein
MMMEREARDGQRTALEVVVTRDLAIEAAQRLRFRIFGVELGATLPTPTPASTPTPSIRSAITCWCATRAPASGGTYRILPGRRGGPAALHRDGVRSRPPAGAAGAGRVGRACIDPRFRNGHVLALLWAGLASHLHERGYEHVMGCASLPEDGAADACARLLRDHPAPLEWRVTPNRPLALDGADPTRRVPLPPLIRGYLRMGAVVCGPPAWDPAFRTADVASSAADAAHGAPVRRALPEGRMTNAEGHAGHVARRLVHRRRVLFVWIVGAPDRALDRRRAAWRLVGRLSSGVLAVMGIRLRRAGATPANGPCSSSRTTCRGSTCRC